MRNMQVDRGGQLQDTEIITTLKAGIMGHPVSQLVTEEYRNRHSYVDIIHISDAASDRDEYRVWRHVFSAWLIREKCVPG